MSQQEPRVQRLRLIRLNRQNKNGNPEIQQNLKPLVQNNRKKLAQKYYYQNNPEHHSPLMKDEKPPVHERLGVKHRFSQMPLGTSTTLILPKRRLLRRNDNFREWRQQRLHRFYSAQSRIERIRSQQRPNSIIKLRRINNNPTVSNLTVQVKNPSYKFGPNGLGNFNSYRFKMFLNPKIRAQILDIQKDQISCSRDRLFPVLNITPVTTSITISERFGML